MVGIFQRPGSPPLSKRRKSPPKHLPSIQGNKEVTLYLHKSPLWLAAAILSKRGSCFTCDSGWKSGRKRLSPKTHCLVPRGATLAICSVFPSRMPACSTPPDRGTEANGHGGLAEASPRKEPCHRRPSQGARVMCMCVTELEVSNRATSTGSRVHLCNCAMCRRGELLELGAVELVRDSGME